MTLEYEVFIKFLGEASEYSKYENVNSDLKQRLKGKEKVLFGTKSAIFFLLMILPNSKKVNNNINKNKLKRLKENLQNKKPRRK